MRSRFLFSRSVFVALFSIGITFNPLAIQAVDSAGPVFQVGGFTATQGKSQHINIEGLIGDNFSVDKSSDQNFLIGAGYYFNGLITQQTSLLYGLNAFYLAPTKVTGKVIQENLFTNLSYQYSRTNYPIFFSARGVTHVTECSDLTMDFGIGPNIVSTHSFKERSLDGGITIPDHIFSGKTTVAFTATAGLGWRFNNLYKNLSIEIDYRFFYLGEGELKKINNQVRNTLHTGNSYGNALFISLSL